MLQNTFGCPAWECWFDALSYTFYVLHTVKMGFFYATFYLVKQR